MLSTGLVSRIRAVPRRAAAVLLAAVVLVGCSPAETPADSTGTTPDTGADFPVSVTFAPEPAVTVDERPERIISLSPASTEMLYAVGAGDQVIAVDEQSNYPEQAPLVPGLSGFTPNVEAVLDHDPDLVILMARTDSVVDGLEAAGVDVLVVPAAVDLEQTYAQITGIGAATGNADRATEVVEDMQADIDTALASVDPAVTAADLSYYHELTSDYYTASGQTYIGQIYELFGLRSIVTGADDYPQLSSEAIVAANPGVIFLANTHAEGNTAELVAARPGWDTIDAVTTGRIINLDDDRASRWGPRVSELVADIAAALNEQVAPTLDDATTEQPAAAA